MSALKCKRPEWTRKEGSDLLLYFSGCRDFLDPYTGHRVTERRIHYDARWSARCFSFAYVGEAARSQTIRDRMSYEFARNSGYNILMDSGAHTFLAQTKSHSEMDLNFYLDQYTEFILRNRQFCDFYVNFDYVKNCREIRRVLHELQKRGIEPAAVYHGDDSISYLERYADEGHKLICVGKPTSVGVGGRRLEPFYDAVFELAAKKGFVVHGFAQTGKNMFRYPWYSVDSTSWLTIARNGRIISFDRHRMRVDIPHVSREKRYSSVDALAAETRQPLIDYVESCGGSWHAVTSSTYARAVFNIRRFQEMCSVRRNKERMDFWL